MEGLFEGDGWLGPDLEKPRMRCEVWASHLYLTVNQQGCCQTQKDVISFTF